jgi:hypothetical protein
LACPQLDKLAERSLRWRSRLGQRRAGCDQQQEKPRQSGMQAVGTA